MNALPGPLAGPLEQNGISVTGEATRSAIPDVADVTVSVEFSGPSAQKTLQETSMRMQRVIASAANIGVKPEDMQTGGWRLDPLYAPPMPPMIQAPQGALMQSGMMPQGFSGLAPQFVANDPQPGPPPIIGYSASNTIRISFEAARIGELIDALVYAGANRIVAGPIFRVREEAPSRRAALSEAAKNAQDKATTIAEALGKRLGNPLTLREEMTFGPFSGSPLLPFAGAGSQGILAGLGLGGAPGVPVSTGELVYQARVHATYALS
jgi:uncharacterized protein YggE